MVVSINALFLLLVFSRHITRRRYFKAFNAARSRYFGTVCAFANEQLTAAKASQALGKAVSIAEQDAVHRMLLESVDDQQSEPHLRAALRSRLCSSLGGRRFRPRPCGPHHRKPRETDFPERTAAKEPSSLNPALRLRFLLGRLSGCRQLGVTVNRGPIWVRLVPKARQEAARRRRTELSGTIR